jgi:hypothetical protein
MKVWIKGPDPQHQCCGCEGKTGPCDSCAISGCVPLNTFLEDVIITNPTGFAAISTGNIPVPTVTAAISFENGNSLIRTNSSFAFGSPQNVSYMNPPLYSVVYQLTINTGEYVTFSCVNPSSYVDPDSVGLNGANGTYHSDVYPPGTWRYWMQGPWTFHRESSFSSISASIHEKASSFAENFYYSIINQTPYSISGGDDLCFYASTTAPQFISMPCGSSPSDPDATAYSSSRCTSIAGGGPLQLNNQRIMLTNNSLVDSVVLGPIQLSQEDPPNQIGAASLVGDFSIDCPPTYTSQISTSLTVQFTGSTKLPRNPPYIFTGQSSFCLNVFSSANTTLQVKDQNNNPIDLLAKYVDQYGTHSGRMVNLNITNYGLPG